MKVSVRIFDDGQRDYLEGAIRLCKPRLMGDWEFSSAADADVIFMSPQDPGVDIFISKFLNSREKIPVIYADKNNTVSPWFVKRSSSQEELIPILNNIYITLHPNEAPAEGRQQPSASGVGSGEMVDSHIDCYESLGSVARITGCGAEDVYYDPRSGVFYGGANADVSQLSQSDSLEITELKNGQIPAGLIELLSLSELKWDLCQLYGPPTLISGAGNLKMYKWPDFAHINHDRGDVSLAAFFTRYVAPPSLASSMLEIPQDKVLKFCNSAIYAGYLSTDVSTTAKTVTVDKVPSKRTGIIRSLVKLMHGDID